MNTGTVPLFSSKKSGLTELDYDLAGRLVKEKIASGGIKTYDYNSLNQLTKVVNARGQSLDYKYDTSNRLAEFAGNKYAYDNNGNILTVTNANGTTRRTYDELNRIVKFTDVNNKTITYTYDKAGNIISENIPDIPNTVPITAHAALANKLMTFKAGNQVDTYNGKKVTYDADGNMTNGPLKGIMTDYKYNELNQLTSVGDTTYKYDGQGTRISQTYKNGSITYVTDPNAGLSRVLQTTENGKIKLYVYGLGLISEEEVAGTTRANFRVYHYDYRGSTIMMTNQSGTMTDHFMYSAYGELLSSAGNTKTAFLYVGKYGVETDQNGLIYMRARYYNTDTQRFVNEDPIKDGLNWYEYGGGNPVSYIDPRGLFWDTLLDIGSVISSYKDYWDDPSAINALLFVVDVVALLLPGIPSVGLADNLAKGGLDFLTSVSKKFGKDKADILKFFKNWFPDLNIKSFDDLDKFLKNIGKLGSNAEDALDIIDSADIPNSNDPTPKSNPNSGSDKLRMTTKEATEAAKKLGYSKTNETSHGQPVYKNVKGKNPKYITPDVDSHNGGVWKGANSVKDLGSKSTRLGTYDGALKRIGD